MHPRRTAELVLVGLAIIQAACTDPAATKDDLCPAAQVPLCTNSDSTVAVVSPMTNDAVTRSAAALANAPLKATLTTEINAVQSAIAVGNVTQARAALTRARAAIVTARQHNSHPGDAPDMSAIELALIQLELATK
jgi:hypothetical protein